MDNADRTTLKDSILQGVYEENLMISDPHAKAGHPARRSGYRGTRRVMSRVMPLLLISMLFVLIHFFSAPIFRQSADPMESSARVSFFPWAEIIHDQQAASAVVPHLFSAVHPVPGPETPFDAQRLLDYDFLFNQDNVRLSSIFGLDVQTIVIDPGHGGKDPGAIGSQGTREKDIVLDIALRLQEQLMEGGRYRVLLTREIDTFMSLSERVEFSNSNKADLFISLHINALPQEEFNVTETFYFGPPSDEYTLRLAEQENRGSEILAGDFKNMIKKIGDVLKEQESATLASAIQNSLFSNMEKYDRVIADNGIKIAPFVVLLGVDAPSVLVEISCITKIEEEANLNNPAYREKITSSLEGGINGYLIKRQTQVVKGDDNGEKILNKKG